MDKPSLMQRLARVRARAEAAHLEVVLHTSRAQAATTESGEAAELAAWKMAEQKLLREMDWILDQLDQSGY